VNYRLLLDTLTRKFRGPMIVWMGFYVTGRTQRVWVGDYLSETIYYTDLLDIFANVRVLAYADDLKLYMRISSTDDCRLFQQDLDRLQGWYREKKYDLNAGKWWVETVDVSICYSDLKRVDVINDLGLLVNNTMPFVNHIESIVSKSASSTTLTRTRRCMWLLSGPGLEYASCVWSLHQEDHLARIERIQHNFIRFAL
jgi:hypothetical protein